MDETFFFRNKEASKTAHSLITGWETRRGRSRTPDSVETHSQPHRRVLGGHFNDPDYSTVSLGCTDRPKTAGNPAFIFASQEERVNFLIIDAVEEAMWQIK